MNRTIFAALSIIVIILALLPPFEFYPPVRDPYLNDDVNIINQTDEQVLKDLLRNIHQTEGIHIVVIIIPSIQAYTFQDKSIDAFTFDVYKSLKRGATVYDDMKALLLVSIGDRKTRIEFGGNYQGKYNEQMKQVIEQYISPSFKTHTYSKGIAQGIEHITGILTNKQEVINLPMAGAGDMHNIWATILENMRMGNGVVIFLSMALFLYLSFFVHDNNTYNNGYYGGDGGSGGGDGGDGGSGGGDGGGGGSGDGASGGW